MTTETIGAICGASRGRYGHPWRILGPRGVQRWVDEDEQPIKPPKTFICEADNHASRRKRFNLADGYVQQWKMSKREVRQAVKNWDMFSLTMPSLLLCSALP